MLPERVETDVLVTLKVRLNAVPVTSCSYFKETEPLNVMGLVPPMMSVWLLVVLGYWNGFTTVQLPPEPKIVPEPAALPTSGVMKIGPVPSGPEVGPTPVELAPTPTP